jgi:uncharacterized protein (TIGR00290 family)
MKEKVLLFWSGGKDSALALYYLKQNPNIELKGLITTFNSRTNSVPYHGIPESLIVEQAKLLKLPVQRIFLPEGASNEVYTENVGKILSMFSKAGITTIAFGDLFLDDVRAFRENFLTPLGLKAIFPLWGKNSKDVVDEFFKTGHKALVTSINTDVLDSNFLACEFNEQFITRLPDNIDPAGENGEYHTFVTFGPYFKMRVPFSKAIAVNEGPYLVTALKEP